MLFLAKSFVFFQLINLIFAEICVLDKLLTLDYPLCNPSDCFPSMKNVECDESNLYRTYDGSCNNLEHPDWGMSGGPYLRILPPTYSDRESLIPALSIFGDPLPEVRVISTTAFPDVDSPWTGFTLSVLQWNQIVAHDIGLGPDAVEGDCCVPPTSELPDCIPISIPPDDYFYSKYDVTCLSMSRTKYIRSSCDNIPYQLNDATHAIDGSFLYGYNEKVAKDLREFKNGRLIVAKIDNKDFPKLSSNPLKDCGNPNKDDICFESGDFRVNQNPPLTSLQTVLTREHNRIADALSELNPNWDDEKLYQEAKKILVAEFQHISYNELLPLILGENYMSKNNLIPLVNGYTTYDKTVNLATISSFTNGAYRIFHSQTDGLLVMYNSSRCPFREIYFSDYMNRPRIVTENSNYDSFILELIIEYTQKTNRFYTTQMTNLMAKGDKPYGKDLVSLDINRGRDHGIPNYNTLREFSGLPVANTFEDLKDVMNEEHIKILESLYQDVNDVDYYVGTLLEDWAPGTSVGPTSLYLLGEQFVRKKVGDRFWYEHGDLPHSFTPDQLQEVRKITLSRLYCDNGDEIETIQPNSFLSESVGNELVPCAEIPAMDLSKWKE